MTRRIAVIGLGKLGLSIGMSLSKKKDQFTTAGLDRNGDMTREVGKLKVFSFLTNRLPEAIEGADAVILAVPFDEVEITLKSIAPLVTPNMLILDMSVVKEATYAWAGKYLPESVQFLSFTPILNPRHLMVEETGSKAAAEDLFENGLFLTCGVETTTVESTRFAAELAAALGGDLYYGEPGELDGILAANELLPELIAAAYLNSLSREGGWHYSAKLTNNGFFALTRPLSEMNEREILGAASLENRKNMLRVLDNLLQELHFFRDALNEKRERDLLERFREALSAHESWLQSRLRGQWEQMTNSNLRGDDGFFTSALGIPSKKKKK